MGRAKLIGLFSLVLILGLGIAAVGQAKKHTVNVVMVLEGQLTRAELGFQTGLQEAGYYVKYKTFTVPGSSSTSEVLKRLPFAKTDLIYVAGLSPHSARLIKNVKDIPIILKLSSPNQVPAAAFGKNSLPDNVTGTFHEVPFPIQHAVAQRLLNFKRLGYLSNPEDPQSRLELDSLIAYAVKEGSFTVVQANVNSSSIDEAVAALKAQKADLLWLPNHSFTARHFQEIVASANRHQLPTFASKEEFVLQGGALLAMVGDEFQLGRTAAAQADKILRHEVEKAGDLPVEGPLAFSPVVNMKTAQTLGIPLPPSLTLIAKRAIRD